MHRLTEYELELVRVIVTHYPVDDELMPFAVEMLMSGVTPMPFDIMGPSFATFVKKREQTPACILAALYKYGSPDSVYTVTNQHLEYIHHEHPHLDQLKQRPSLGDQ